MNSLEMSPLILRAMSVRDDLLEALGRNLQGLTIAELVKNYGLSRSAVIMELVKLEGANSVSIRRAGMTKIYMLEDGGK